MIFYGHVGKQLDKKATVSCKIYDIIYWEINKYNKNTTQHLKK